MKSNQRTTYKFIKYLVLCFITTGCFASAQNSESNRLGPGLHKLTLTVENLKRTYVVHVPSNNNPETPTPLVIMLHGGGGTARAAIWQTGWTEKADEVGFLAVFPNAMARDPSQRSSFSSNPQLWNDGSNRFYPDQKKIDDIHFIAALLDDLSTRFVIDKRRVFVTGFSNGASMSFLVGAQLSDRVAAIAPVAGACWIEPTRLERPVSMLYITGNADPLNLIEGGVPKLATGFSDKVRAKPKPPVRESIMKWAKALECSTTPTSISDVNGVRSETYGFCNNNAEVLYIVVEGLGHTWAGGRSLLPERWVGRTSNKINATDIIWDFFLVQTSSGEDSVATQQMFPAERLRAR
jgi:polyhydroxybutyrate depolymerase